MKLPVWNNNSPLRTLDFAPYRGNPKHYSCHLDETMVGVCKNLWLHQCLLTFSIQHWRSLDVDRIKPYVETAGSQEDSGALPCIYVWLASPAALLLHGCYSLARWWDFDAMSWKRRGTSALSPGASVSGGLEGVMHTGFWSLKLTFFIVQMVNIRPHTHTPTQTHIAYIYILYMYCVFIHIQILYIQNMFFPLAGGGSFHIGIGSRLVKQLELAICVGS